MLKNSTLIALLVLLSISVNAQTSSFGVSGNQVNIILFDDDSFKGSDVEGTPYVVKDFREAKINKDDKIYKVRYNANTDQMEIDLEASGVIVLDEKAKEYEIEFLETGEKYALIKSYVPERTYGKILWENSKNQKLVKVESINFVPSQTSNGYTPAKNAKYTNLKEDLYFYDGKSKEAIELPNSANRKIKELFDNTAKKYIKDQNWDMNNEQDLIKAMNKFYGE
jgi:hypothetical protein